MDGLLKMMLKLTCAGYFTHPTTRHVESTPAPALLVALRLGVRPLEMKE